MPEIQPRQAIFNPTGGHAQAGGLLILLAAWWTWRLGIQIRRSIDDKYGYVSRDSREGSTFYISNVLRHQRWEFPSTILSCIIALGGALREFYVQGSGNWGSPDNLSHTAAYLMYFFAFATETFCYFSYRFGWKIVPEQLPQLAWAMNFFSISFILRAHEMGKPMLEVAVHTWLGANGYFVTAFLVLEAFMPRNHLVALGRCIATYAMGIYFIRMLWILEHLTDFDPPDSDPEAPEKVLLGAIQYGLVAALSLIVVIFEIFLSSTLVPYLGHFLEPLRWFEAEHPSFERIERAETDEPDFEDHLVEHQDDGLI